MFERPDGHGSFWVIKLNTGFNFPVTTTVMIKDLLDHGSNKNVFVRLTHFFFEYEGIILLKVRKDLIDRVEEVDSVINGTHSSFSFSQKTLSRRRSGSKYVSRDSGNCGEAIEREEEFNEVRRSQCSG